MTKLEEKLLAQIRARLEGLDVRASDINDEMKLAASYAIASLVSDDELTADYILPKAFDKRIAPAVAAVVAQAARDSGVARI